MTLPADLDTWATALSTSTGITTTRDPDLVNPTCIYVAAPGAAKQTLASLTLEVPVYLVAAGWGLPALDHVLALLPAVLDRCQVKTATWTTLTIGGVDYPAYLITTPVQFT